MLKQCSQDKERINNVGNCVKKCANGSVRHLITRRCRQQKQQKQQKQITKTNATKKRCPNGSRRNKAGVCIPTHHSPAPPPMHYSPSQSSSSSSLHYLAPQPSPQYESRGKIDFNGVKRSIGFLNDYNYKIVIPNTGTAIIRISRIGQQIGRIVVGDRDNEIVVLPTDNFDTFLNKLTVSCHLIHTQNLRNIMQTPFTRSNATSWFVYDDDPAYVSNEEDHQLGFKLYKIMCKILFV